jgi:hypothetical protein
VQKAANDTWQNIISGTIYEHLLLAESGILKCGHNELISLTDTVPLTNGEWYHVAVTFHYGSGELILYKNGSPVASKIVDAAKKDMTNAQTFIGRSGGGASWRGVIDDVRIYAHVLSPEQIAAMYNGGSGNNNVIVSQEIAAGDTWQCEVTPFSNSEKGGTQPSNPVTIASPVPDINGDGDVDGDDLHLFMLTFNLLSGDADFDYRCDFNMDEIVDLLDFGEIASKFGSVNP